MGSFQLIPLALGANLSVLDYFSRLLNISDDDYALRHCLSGLQFKNYKSNTSSLKLKPQTIDNNINKNIGETIEPLTVNPETAEPTCEQQDNSATLS